MRSQAATPASQLHGRVAFGRVIHARTAFKGIEYVCNLRLFILFFSVPLCLCGQFIWLAK